MKNINKFLILLSVSLLIAAAFGGCTDEDNYDYNTIVPKVLGGIKGSTIGTQTFTADYTLAYHRGGSSWNWTASQATVKSVSADTRTATIEFSEYPSDGFATITVTETTMGGITSDPVSLEVQVNQYCPLSGLTDLDGSWSGTDGQGDVYTFESQITTEVSGDELAVTGISIGFINGFWGESVIEGGTVLASINLDGTVDIPRQYIYTTEYDGAPYDYEIEGSGTWDNCGDVPALLINYDIYYAGDTDGLAKTYSSYLGGVAYLTADIKLTGAKSAAMFSQTPLKKAILK